MKNHLRPVMTMTLSVVLLGLMLFCTSCGKSEEQDWAKKEEQVLAIMDDDIDREKLNKLMQIRPGWTADQVITYVGKPDEYDSGLLGFDYHLSNAVYAHVVCSYQEEKDARTVSRFVLTNQQRERSVICIENFKFVPAE